MDATLFAIALLIAILAVLGAVAGNHGIDSRPGFGPTSAR